MRPVYMKDTAGCARDLDSTICVGGLKSKAYPMFFQNQGHHRHIGTAQVPYFFMDLEKLRNDFKADLETEMSKKGLT